MISNITNLIPIKLDSSNYLLWKSMFEPILIGERLEGYINGAKPAPPKTLNDDDDTPNQAYWDWFERDKTLLSSIIATLSDSALPYIVGTDTSKDAWDSLESRYASLSRSHVIELKKRLQQVKKYPFTTMQEYLDHIKALSHQLANCGFPVSEDDLIVHTLAGLPSVYRPFKASLRRDLVSLEELHALLVRHEELGLITEDTVTDVSSTALIESQLNPFQGRTLNHSPAPHHRGESSGSSNSGTGNRTMHHNNSDLDKMGKTIRVFGFPSSARLKAVKEFLEGYTGEKTVYALKIRDANNAGPRVYAIVQFTTREGAQQIITLAAQCLQYGNFYLKASEVKHDIDTNPRDYLLSMEHIRLHLGCQTASDKFSVLWRVPNVSVKFGLQLKKIYFQMSYLAVEYKLELRYEDIWQIQLHRPRGQASKFLLIQFYGAPRIYEKVIGSSGHVSEDPTLNYFMNTPDGQWVRTTDFTSSSLIGQSSGICLELPYGRQIPDFQENFPFYKKNYNKLVLSDCSTFSHNMDLVPIMGPPLGVDLPYEILFKISCLVQNGCLAGPTLDAAFFRLVDPRRFDIVCIENALEKLYSLKECCYQPVSWLREQYMKYRVSRRPLLSPAISLDSGLVYVRRVQVTPCKVFFCGPEVNVSNRVLRNYPDDIDNFIRVSFIDEDWDKMRSTDLSPSRSSSATADRRTKIYTRILSTLRNGIAIGNKKFEFLAFSSSQLRDNSVWMFASRPGLTAGDIREWMGNFRQIKNVAKYAARLGQSFGSSTETLNVYRHETETIPDVEVETRGTNYNFSDGIGKISAEFARKVAAKCGFKEGSRTPSAFQVRYGGYKGVVAVDPTSSIKLSLRPSMCKYESENPKLDVLAWSKFQPCYLNRQLIILLSTLGVSDLAFERKQTEVVDQLNSILTDSIRAQEALEMMPFGECTNILKEMLLVGYKPNAEPYLSMMLQTFRASKLLGLRLKSRIFVQDGRLMMGCLDETGTLEYGQVFVQYSGIGSDKHTYIVQRNVVVAKNPCLHPGDVRVLRAVDVPALHHMLDCVVFPQKGTRPHPNECSGSDLDGDIYFVCWDPALIPPQQKPPMDYAPAPRMLLDHDVTMEEVEEYFANYIVNDSLGIIAHAHTAFADKEPDKAMSSPCIQLAKLHSIAVDFPKTGVPAEIPSHLHVKVFPDFMEKPDKPTYESSNVIGKLFREVKDIDLDSGSTISSFTREVAMQCYDTDMEVDGFENYIGDAFWNKSNYDKKLGNLLDYYGIKTESELLSGSVMKMSKSYNRKRDQDAITAAVRSLRKEARAWFDEKASGSEFGNEDVYAKASAWYHVTYHHNYWGCYNEGMNRDHYLSFAWCVYDKLIQIKRDKASLRMALHLSSLPLEHQFSHGLSLY